MDPKQCLLDARDALMLRDWSTARRLAGEYYGWRNKGGFMPVLTTTDRLGYDGLPYRIDGNDWACSIVSVANRRPKNPTTDSPAFLNFAIQ